jgi:hypothetical protein
VGEDLENVASSYVTSREFAERGLLNKTYRDQVELVRLPRFSVFASKEDLAIGQHVVGGSYEPGIATILDRYVKPGMSVVDIGANIFGYNYDFRGLRRAIWPRRGGRENSNPDNIKLLEASVA